MVGRMSRQPIGEYRTFQVLKTQGHVPPGLSEATICTADDNLYLFGGDAGDDCTNEIYQFNFNSEFWARIPITGCAPAARSGHSCIVYRDEMVIYGGMGQQQSYWGDIYVFSFETHMWRFLITPEPSSPRARYRHTAVLHGNHMYIFGGKTDTDRMNDLWRFDFSQGVWKQLDPQGPLPPPREMHTAVVYQNKMIVFGGLGNEAFSDLWEYDFEKNRWTQVNVLNKKKVKPRYCHSAVISGGSMVVFGGITDSRMNDVWKYTISMQSGKEETSLKKTLPPRSQHRAVIYHGDMYIYGGHDGNSCLNELVRYVLLPPSTIASDMQQCFMTNQDCEIRTRNGTHKANRAIVKARFPFLLSYATVITPLAIAQPSTVSISSSLSVTSQHCEDVPILDASDRVVSLILDYINGSSYDINILSTEEIVELLQIAEQNESIILKTACNQVLMTRNLNDLEILKIVMIAAHEFGLVELERRAFVHFVSLLPFSIPLLATFPQSSLLYYSTCLAAITNQGSPNPQTELDSLFQVAGREQDELNRIVKQSAHFSDSS
ncbi:putative Host cell factor 1 [Blattamonas nauphoetae]|uniref:Host cell factor 1 n=1 Tax=Blattamonas nauphoetae TaxID=2049346 RepID=A0ABQ9YKF7_9EUKA|nr:putative Host cell factor 1 [Blattamonas nauphoetae]